VIWDVIATYLEVEVTLVAIVLYADWARRDFPTARIVGRWRRR